MRKYFLIAGAAVALGAASLGSMAVVAQAQVAPLDAPPPGAQPGPDGRRMGGPPGWGMHMPWHRPPGGGPEEGRPGGWAHRPHMPMMGLFYPTEDKSLSGADVQKIAEAFLLWNGNRAWKVANVAENQDNTVSFAFAAPDGTVIARFSVDRKTGHFRRLG